MAKVSPCRWKTTVLDMACPWVCSSDFLWKDNFFPSFPSIDGDRNKKVSIFFEQENVVIDLGFIVEKRSNSSGFGTIQGW
jgi:hypothetical protein